MNLDDLENQCIICMYALNAKRSSVKSSTKAPDLNTVWEILRCKYRKNLGSNMYSHICLNTRHIDNLVLIN
jgi:hypothetical protein